MNQWQGFCQRCCVETNSHIMSMLNEELICMECKDREKKRPDYRSAEIKDLREYADRLDTKYKLPGVSDSIREQANRMEK